MHVKGGIYTWPLHACLLTVNQIQKKHMLDTVSKNAMSSTSIYNVNNEPQASLLSDHFFLNIQIWIEFAAAIQCLCS